MEWFDWMGIGPNNVHPRGQMPNFQQPAVGICPRLCLLSWSFAHPISLSDEVYICNNTMTSDTLAKGGCFCKYSYENRPLIPRRNIRFQPWRFRLTQYSITGTAFPAVPSTWKPWKIMSIRGFFRCDQRIFYSLRYRSCKIHGIEHHTVHQIKPSNDDALFIFSS